MPSSSLIPLGCAGFPRRRPRKPLIGIVLAFAQAWTGFNVLPRPLLPQNRSMPVSVRAPRARRPRVRGLPRLSNIYFTVPSSIFLAALITWVMEKWVAPRVEGLELDGPWAPGSRRTSSVGNRQHHGPPRYPMELSSAEKRGVRNALIAPLPSWRCGRSRRHSGRPCAARTAVSWAPRSWTSPSSSRSLSRRARRGIRGDRRHG